MPTTVDFPTLVNQALELFGDVFDNEPARRHFAEYLTGLMVAERKNISAINRQFAVTTDQSCLNRWLVESDWDAAALNERRLNWLQDNPNTRLQPARRHCHRQHPRVGARGRLWSITAASSSRTWAGCGTMPIIAMSSPTTT